MNTTGNTNRMERLQITSEMILNAQTLEEVERYRDEILAYKTATINRFMGYEKLTAGQAGFLKYLNALRKQCHFRIATLLVPMQEAKILSRNERIISCLFMKYAKEELSEEQYCRIYGKALEKVGANLQKLPTSNENFMVDD